tara:strand:- start:731 stop:1162 length:432 start_codon:yes stop_codon:yes gene_type:complete
VAVVQVTNRPLALAEVVAAAVVMAPRLGAEPLVKEMLEELERLAPIEVAAVAVELAMLGKMLMRVEMAQAVMGELDRPMTFLAVQLSTLAAAAAVTIIGKQMMMPVLEAPEVEEMAQTLRELTLVQAQRTQAVAAVAEPTMER